MAKYAAAMARTASTTASVGTITSSATVRRTKIYDLTFGSEASPADNVFKWQITRCTAPGTNTGVTPSPLDPADAAALTVVGQINTVEPTGNTPLLFAVELNQRATLRWVAAPGSELVTPATSSNGVGIQTPTATAVLITLQTMFEEQ